MWILGILYAYGAICAAVRFGEKLRREAEEVEVLPANKWELWLTPAILLVLWPLMISKILEDS